MQRVRISNVSLGSRKLEEGMFKWGSVSSRSLLGARRMCWVILCAEEC